MQRVQHLTALVPDDQLSQKPVDQEVFAVGEIDEVRRIVASAEGPRLDVVPLEIGV